ncbi:MAG: S41 family peptidase [Bacteroidota bacterium]
MTNIVSAIRLPLSCFLLAGVLGVFSSCCQPESLTPLEGASKHQQLFQEYWDIFDRYYPLFFRKQIDWEQVKETYASQITETTTDQELHHLLTEINESYIRDGHTHFTSPIGEISYEGQETAFVQEDQIIANSDQIATILGGENDPYLTYGTLKQDASIGYILSKRFEPVVDEDSEYNNFRASADAALEALKDSRGVVVDLRINGGGQATFASYLAGRFFDVAQLPWTRVRVKTGRGSSEEMLGEWLTSSFHGTMDCRVGGEGTVGSADNSNNTIIQSGEFQFTRQVVVLTSRGTASAAEFFTAAMRNLDHVTVLGDTTFGIFSGSDQIALHYGKNWSVNISVHDVEVYEKDLENYRSYEGVGIAPDELLIPAASSEIGNGKDLHIDRAAEIIQQ